jgi:four helix bundle suffix protein
MGLRKDLLDHNYQTVDQLAQWIVRNCKDQAQKTPDITDHQILYPEYSANAALALIHLSCYFLDKQVAKLATEFKEKGGFSEKLYKVRKEERDESR